jgi:hypothetical protein
LVNPAKIAVWYRRDRQFVELAVSVLQRQLIKIGHNSAQNNEPLKINQISSYPSGYVQPQSRVIFLPTIITNIILGKWPKTLTSPESIETSEVGRSGA